MLMEGYHLGSVQCSAGASTNGQTGQGVQQVLTGGLFRWVDEEKFLHEGCGSVVG